MMRANQIIASAPPELVAEMLGYFRDEEREAYRTALGTLAGQRRLRPVFVQKKPVAQQIEWMAAALHRRQADAVAEQLLQVWLMKAHGPMLVEFLDTVGIEHDGSGAIDELPESLEGKKVGEAVGKLLESRPAPMVALYLRVFQLQRQGGWPEVAEAMESHPALADDEAAAGASSPADTPPSAAADVPEGEEPPGEAGAGEASGGDEAASKPEA